MQCDSLGARVLVIIGQALKRIDKNYLLEMIFCDTIGSSLNFT